MKRVIIACCAAVAFSLSVNAEAAISIGAFIPPYGDETNYQNDVNGLNGAAGKNHAFCRRATESGSARPVPGQLNERQRR